MAAGLISQEQFERYALELAQKANVTGDNWTINKHAGNTYLSKRVLTKISGEPANAPNEGSDSMENEEALEDNDAASLAGREDHEGRTMLFEYHILYSESYSVPVMYFNVHLSDGRLLPLEQVWQLIPHSFQQRLQEDRWSFITQQEHPYLSRPFFQLHPCHTESLMSCLKEMPQQEKVNYLISWLSVVGPVVLLDVPLAYGKMSEGTVRGINSS